MGGEQLVAVTKKTVGPVSAMRHLAMFISRYGYTRPLSSEIAHEYTTFVRLAIKKVGTAKENASMFSEGDQAVFAAAIDGQIGFLS